MEGKLFSTKEAADFLHVSLRTFKYWTSAKKIAPVQFGAKGAKFYSPVQLENFRGAKTTRANIQKDKGANMNKQENQQEQFGSRSADNFEAVEQEFIADDIAEAQAHLEELPENQRRGLSLDTLRHFHCGYLSEWEMPQRRAKFVCGHVDKETGKPIWVPPPSERIIIPTSSLNHFNAVATPRQRDAIYKEMFRKFGEKEGTKRAKKLCKQHAGTMELFCDPAALQADTIVIVEGEIDCMSIWQATQGKVAVAAILGCGNANATLGVRLQKDLKGKRFVLMLDADAPGKKSAKELRDKLIAERVPVVIRYLYDYLPPNDKEAPQAVHVDANDILKYQGEQKLKNILERALANVDAELDSVAAQIEQDIAAAGNEDAEPNLKVVSTARAVGSKKVPVAVNENDDADDADDADTTDATDDKEARLIIADALKFCHARNLTYGEWFAVGCVMKRYGFTLADFQKWSNDGDERYSAANCNSQWEQIRTAEELSKDAGYKIGTLINIARKHSKKYDLIFCLFKGDASDLDFARRFERVIGDRVRWLTDSERWLIYGGGVWTRNSEKNSCVLPLVREVVDLMSRHTARIEKREKLAANLKSTRKMASSLTALKALDSILITQDDLDTHDELLNVLNGVVDLTTGKLLPADPSLLLTRQCRAVYDPAAREELVDNFFRDIMPDEETRAGLLRWLGFCLTGKTKAEKFAIWHGRGANGKGVLGTTYLELLGDYAVGLTPRALLKSNRAADANAATASLNGLDGARFAISEELPADAELDVSTLKNLTGGDRINLRGLYSEYRTIINRAKLNISGNYLPRIENINDEGLLRRIINFPFTVQFGKDRPADFSLKEKMLQSENLSALLAILVQEAVKWYRGDDGGLIISPLMKAETQKHLTQNNFVAEFIADNYVCAANAEIKAKDFIAELKAAYPSECRPLKRADLIKMVERAGATYCDDSNHCRIFKGIGKPPVNNSRGYDYGGKPVAKNDIPFD